MPAGRRSEFSQEMADAVCKQLAEGKSLRSIAKLDKFPCVATVCKWLRQFPQFAEQYAHAREAQAEVLASEIIDIADEEIAFVKDGNGEEAEIKFDSTAVARNRLRVDARKWYASKLAPKKYGDKVENTIQGPEGGAIKHDHTITLTPDEAYKRMLDGQ